MVEKFLVDLFQRVKKNRIAIILSGDFVDNSILEFLPKLRSKLKDVGEVKVAKVIYEGTLPDKHFELLREAGFSHKIAPSYGNLNFLIEVYDLYLSEEIDIIILGINTDTLFPLYTEIRQKSTLYGINSGSSISNSIIESFDGVINIDNLDDFHFDQQSIPEFAIEGSQFGNGFSNPQYLIDLANIGITSDKIEYLDDDEDIINNDESEGKKGK